MNSYKIASIPGDGIGKEVLPESLKVLREVAKKHQFEIHFDDFDFYHSGPVNCFNICRLF